MNAKIVSYFLSLLAWGFEKSVLGHKQQQQLNIFFVFSRSILQKLLTHTVEWKNHEQRIQEMKKKMKMERRKGYVRV